MEKSKSKESSPFGEALVHRKAMLRTELLQFLDLDDVKKLLHLNRASYHLTREHFIDTKLSVEQIVHFLGSGIETLDGHDLNKMFPK